MIYAFEHHDRLLALWREQELRQLALAHVDFHDDLRGLLVDRSRCIAYAVGSLARGRAPVDAGNFLAHAVLEGRLERLRWIHGSPGGRAWDMGIVRYESDLAALPQRWRHAVAGGPEFALAFEETLVDSWDGLAAGERLSIDWDCFASILLDSAGVGRRVEAFLRRLGDRIPPDTYLTYSPDYCHPSLEGFAGLVGTLAQIFDQPVEWLSPGLPRGELNPTGVEARLPGDPFSRVVLYLRRSGLF